MKNYGWFSRILNQQPSSTRVRRAGCALAVVMVLAGGGFLVAQGNPAAPAPESKLSTPEGYTSHHSIDMGGRISDVTGSGSMYNYLVNLHSGPRVLGETFEMHALPGKKGLFVDDLNAFGTGFGGDPNIMAKLAMSKTKYYEFTGLFRQDRLYADYNLLANPNIPPGLSIPIGPTNAPVGQLPWPQVKKSPVMFNTVRRMTDTGVTIKPFSTFSYRLGFSHSTMEGPSLSPSYTILKYNALLQQFQRNGNENYLGALDWRPSRKTTVTFEAEVNHYKGDTFFQLDPNGFLVQEADGTKVYLGNYTSFVPYGAAPLSTTVSGTGAVTVTGACNTTSMGGDYTNSTTFTILRPAQPGGLPIINPACAAVTSYYRSSPTRIWTPTGTIRFQTSAVKNIAMNGRIHYTRASTNMPVYYENAQGLSTLSSNGTANRQVIWTGGHADAARYVFGADYGIVWKATEKVSISDLATFYNMQQPGSSIIPPQTALANPAGAGNGTINYSGALVPGTASLPHGVNGTLTYGFLGQQDIVNALTAGWDMSARARFSLTYRYSNRKIGQGVPHTGPIDTTTDPIHGELTINENAGVLNAAVRPASNWDLNGTAEIAYYDNALTTVLPRQFKQFRVHTVYRPKPWATISGSTSIRERHNNTFVPSQDEPYLGPVNHVDYARIGSAGVVLTPNGRYSIDLNYSYNRVYAATNICYANGATATAPGAATVTVSGAPNLCPAPYQTTWFGRDFMDAPTNIGSAGVTYNATEKTHFGAGYMVSAVNGSRFFNDARDVNGSMHSTYQTPYVNLSYAMRPTLVWKADYNYYGYGEGGPSGAALCSTAVSATATISPCSSFAGTGVNLGTPGATTPRVFHANNVTLGVHYEF
jgi:hypothetical protein